MKSELRSSRSGRSSITSDVKREGEKDLQGHHFIGARTSAASGRTFNAFAPAEGRELEAFAEANAEEVASACELAAKAFADFRRRDADARAALVPSGGG